MSQSGRAGRRFAIGLVTAAAALWSGIAAAVPTRIILLRHGEKGGPWTLCEVGRERARALAAYYVGKGAQKSVFRPGETPKAILGISLHTLETIYPVADSWDQPVVFYAAMPELVDGRFLLRDDRLNARTREAVRDMMEKPEWAGETLLVNWEHDHIARTEPDLSLPVAEQDRTYFHLPSSEEKATLYTLLGLDQLPGVPKTWPDNTYDYIWIIDFDQKTGKPSAFSMVKEEFGPPFQNVPQNDWGKSEGLTVASGCVLP